jgi:hypothetical protein
MTHLMTILSSPSYKGFYLVSGLDPNLDGTQTHTVPSGSKLEYDTRTLKPLCESPAEIRGNAQLIPRSKFLGNGVAILNFRLDSFHLDTGDLGKILGPFASAFFPEDGKNMLIFENIVYDLTQSRTEHERRIHGVVGQLRAARWGLSCQNSSELSPHRCCQLHSQDYDSPYYDSCGRRKGVSCNFFELSS